MSETQVITTEVTGDITYTKEEVFDVDFARQLVSNKGLAKEERRLLQRYLKERVDGNKRNVQYKLGKYVKHDGIGRLCAVGGESLQCLSRDIRGALAKPYYWDVDMVNAQPTLLVQLCERNGWMCDAIREYVAKRDEMLQDVQETLGVKRWEAKQRIVALFFGSTDAEGMPPFFRESLLPELRKVMASNWGHHCDGVLKWLEKQPNRVGRGLAYILQTEERKCLLAMDEAFGRRGRRLDVYIHDGGLVRKREGETNLSLSLLREVEADVLKKTGYQVHLIVKPLETSFVKEDEEDDYLPMKETFEKTHFKLRKPFVFVRHIGAELQMLSEFELKGLHRELKCNGRSFVERWLDDESKRAYESLIFAPKMNVPDDCFNLFTGFAVEPKEGGDISGIRGLTRMLTGHNEALHSWLEKWAAHIVQKPFQKTEVAAVIIGHQGIGKDSYGDFLGELLGSCYYNTKTPENDVFARFNSCIKKAVLVKFEEVNFKTIAPLADSLKGLITSKKQNIEQKGKDTIVLDSFVNIMMTSNHDVPIKIEEGDRRFVVMRGTDEKKVYPHLSAEEKKKRTDYWNSIYAQMNNPEVQSAYLHYLLNLDISDFNPSRDRILTQDYVDARQAMTPYHARWFQHLIEQHEHSDTIVFKNYELLRDIRNASFLKMSDLNPTRLGRDIRQYIDGNALEKKRHNDSYQYTMVPADMKRFLQSQGWWTEY